jgi:hypothetical protein
MKPIYMGPRAVILAVLLILFRGLPVTGQTTLLTESFENGGALPSGWGTEIIASGNQMTFVTNSANPPGFTAFDGTWMCKFNSYDAPGGVIRLKRVTPVSTIGVTFLGADFEWLESTAYAAYNDRVDLEWSTDGITWTLAGTFPRYNAVQGWKYRSVILPPGAVNQPALYLAFKFTSEFGNNCFMDLVHLTGFPPPPPVTITVGTGTTPCSYPYTTGYMDARTQMLYTSAEIYAAGGSAGQIQQIGFNVSAASASVMNGFTIKLRNMNAGTLIGWMTDSMTVCYSGIYAVPSTGWQMITLQTPFSYDGRNLLVEICYDNSTTGTSTQVYGSSASGKIYHDYLNDPAGGGCTATGNTPQTIRPNLRIFEQQYVGSLTGTVTSCFDGGPITGAIVTCGTMPPVITNSSGNFCALNIPAGTWQVTITLPGFIPLTCPATIFPNQNTVCSCSCISPIPAYLTGTITNIITGDPIVGALVAIDNPINDITYSVSMGYYNLAVYPCGTFTPVIWKTGFDGYILGPNTFICGNTYTHNAQLIPAMYPPQNVTAVTDTVLGQTSINWSPPAGLYEILYDDGIEDQCAAWMAGGNIQAEKFTPAAYPATLESFKLNLCNPAPSGNMPLVPFQVNIYDDSGPGGSPGSVLAGPFDITPVNSGWISFQLPEPLSVSSGSVFIGMVQGGDYPNCAGLALDTTTNLMRSWQKDVNGSGLWAPVQGNFMIRTVMNGSDGTIPSSMLSYKISRLTHGQENTPAAWTTLGTVTGSTSYTDNSWVSLPCGPYRWAVQAFYGAFNPSGPGFSNIGYKCWTGDVAVYSVKCCADMTGPISVRLQSADTTFIAETDTAGFAHFLNIPYDNYTINISIFGCSSLSQPVTVNSDTSFSAPLGGGPAYPPTGMEVDDQSLFAAWNAPRPAMTLFSEHWASGNFSANSWTVSGGTNWGISGTFGNPAPSAAFNWSPQVTNYDQYLTSHTMTGVNAMQTVLRYDIYLSLLATTYVNNMAVEIWDGSGWNVLKTYNSVNGPIPWTSETLLLPVTPNSDYKIRFHASGVDSYDINNWNIDNIEIIARDTIHCLIGYGFYLNNSMSAFVYDTNYTISPNQVIYGQTYTACAVADYNYNIPGSSTPTCATFVSHFLYSPVSFTAVPLECSAFLSWEEPEVLGGGSPPGLIGYRIYRDGLQYDTVMSPDTLQYYDLALDPGNYAYAITALYDLAIYGFPGQFDESLLSDYQYVDIICGDNLPFTENWNSGSFNYSEWTFEPSQGNWNVTSGTGNPPPTADFSGLGLKANGPYDYAMISRTLNASQWTCSEVWLNFDLKLVDFSANSSEHLTVEVLYDNTWHQVADFVNNGSFGFETEHINLNAVKGKGLKVRFRAHGQNSFNILHWYIDNISVYGVCLPPLSLNWTANTDQVNLSWEAPCQEVNGYNIYRTDSSGNLPYYKLNSGLITGTSYADIPTYWIPDAVYRYYVTAVTMDESGYDVLCESGSTDTALVAYPMAVPGLDANSVEVFPNPARQVFTVKSALPLTGIEMVSNLGRTVYLRKFNRTLVERIRTSDFADGVYFLKVTGEQGTVVKKIIIQKP